MRMVVHEWQIVKVAAVKTAKARVYEHKPVEASFRASLKEKTVHSNSEEMGLGIQTSNQISKKIVHV